jgi:hypothetical protein
MSSATEEEAAKKAREAIVEIVTKSYDKASAYTNLIMIAGYAGSFTIWSFTKQYLTARCAIAVALALGISLCAFVLFETFKMIVSTRNFLVQRKLLVRGLSPKEFLIELNKLKDGESNQTLKLIMPVWMGVMVIAVGGGLIGIALLFYNFLSILLGLPPWPP